MTAENPDKSSTAARLEHVDRCLAMVLHHEEIELIADVAREIISEQGSVQAGDEEVAP